MRKKRAKITQQEAAPSPAAGAIRENSRKPKAAASREETLIRDGCQEKTVSARKAAANIQPKTPSISGRALTAPNMPMPREMLSD